MKPETQTDQQFLQEEEILGRAKNNPSAFKPLYEKYYKPVFLFVLHRVGERDITADLTSQIFLKALLKLHQFRFRGLPFSSWLYRIAVNECNDFFRRNKRERLVVLNDSHAETLYEEMFGHETMKELKEKLPFILERLSVEEMEFIELRFMEGRPFKEVADILGISETYAKVKTYRILEKMKKLFVGK